MGKISRILGFLSTLFMVVFASQSAFADPWSVCQASSNGYNAYGQQCVIFDESANSFAGADNRIAGNGGISAEDALLSWLGDGNGNYMAPAFIAGNKNTAAMNNARYLDAPNPLLLCPYFLWTNASNTTLVKVVPSDYVAEMAAGGTLSYGLQGCYWPQLVGTTSARVFRGYFPVGIPGSNYKTLYSTRPIDVSKIEFVHRNSDGVVDRIVTADAINNCVNFKTTEHKEMFLNETDQTVGTLDSSTPLTFSIANNTYCSSSFNDVNYIDIHVSRKSNNANDYTTRIGFGVGIDAAASVAAAQSTTASANTVYSGEVKILGADNGDGKWQEIAVPMQFSLAYCPAGYQKKANDNFSCAKCPTGTVRAAYSTDGCVACSDGTVPDDAQSACEEPPVYVYTISIDLNGGSSDDQYEYSGITAIRQTYGESVEFYVEDFGGWLDANEMKANAFSAAAPYWKTGYTFNGFWTAASGGTQLVDANGYITDAFTNTRFTTNSTIYAQYKPATYGISYGMNLGTNYSGAPTKYTYGVGATINGTPTRTGYTFAGWCDDSALTTNCSTTRTISTTATGNKKFYASWVLNTSEVYFVCGDEIEKPLPDYCNTTVSVSDILVNEGGWFPGDGNPRSAPQHVDGVPFVGFYDETTRSIQYFEPFTNLEGIMLPIAENLENITGTVRIVPIFSSGCQPGLTDMGESCPTGSFCPGDVDCPSGVSCPNGKVDIEMSCMVGCGEATGGVYTFSHEGSKSVEDCYRNLEGGAYVPNVGSAETECPAGYYCPVHEVYQGGYSQLGTDYKKCPESYPSSAKGSNEEADCYVTLTSGQYIATANGPISECTEGMHCPGGGTVYYGKTGGMSSCPAGYKCNGGVATPCPSGTYQAMGTHTTCLKISDGYYGTSCKSDGTTCTGQKQCDAGYKCVDGVRFECLAGTYSTAGATSCTDVPNGHYAIGCIDGKLCTGVTECDAGYYCKDAIKDSCESGQYSAAGASECTPIPEGSIGIGCFEDKGNITCTGTELCSAGYYCLGGTAPAEQCPEDKPYSNNGAKSAAECQSDPIPGQISEGYYVDTEIGDTIACNTATSGQYTNGYYCPGGSYTQPLSCATKIGDAEYAYADTGASSVKQCYKLCKFECKCPENSISCIHANDTNNGKWYNDGKNTCKANANACNSITALTCQPGYVAKNVGTSDAYCAGNSITIKFDLGGLGTIANKTCSYGNSANCLAPSYSYDGKLLLGWAIESDKTNVKYDIGADISKSVTSGTITLHAVWQECSSGYFCKNNTQTACTGNTYSAAGASACTNLTPGYQLLRCEYGKGDERYGCKGEKMCDAGTYCVNGDVYNCTGNTYSLAGATECTSVPDGYLLTGCNNEGNKCTGITECPAGYECKNNEKELCEGGTYTKNGLCYEIPEGYYGINCMNGKDGRVCAETEECPIGYYCDGQITDETGPKQCPTDKPNSLKGSEGIEDCTNEPLDGQAQPGYYNGDEGQTPCGEYGSGYYCTGGTSQPQSCAEQIGDAEYAYADYNAKDKTGCYKNCANSCPSCPEKSTSCTYENSDNGKMYYGKTVCEKANNACSSITSLKCQSGYTATGIGTLDAHCEPNQFTITFNSNGATSGVMPPMVCTVGSNDCRASTSDRGNLDKPGYYIKGWSKSAGGTVDFDPGALISGITTDLTLYAVWQYCPAGSACSGGKQTICGAGTYQQNITQSECKPCPIGSYSIKPTSAAVGNKSCILCKPGQTTNSTGSESCDATCPGFSLTETFEDTILNYTENNVDNLCVAKTCVPEAYFVNNMCTECPDGTNCSGSGIITCSSGYFLKNGTTCTKCPTNSNNATTNTFSNCTCNSGYSVGGTLTGSTTTNSAQCSEITYTISYELNGGDQNPGNKTTYKVTSADVVLYNPTRAHSAFVSWHKDSSLSAASKVTKIEKGSTGNITLYAKWSCDNGYSENASKNACVANEITLDWQENLGNTINSGKCTYGGTFTLPSATRTGHTLTHWLLQDGSKKNAGETVQCTNEYIGAFSGTSTVILAMWEPNKYIIEYNKNADGATGETKSSEHTYGESKNLTSNGYKLDDHLFKGWSRTSNGNKEYDDGASVTNLSDDNNATVPLYAVWNECTPCSADIGATCVLSVVDNTCTYTTECKTGYENIKNDGTSNPSCSAIICPAGRFYFDGDCEKCPPNSYTDGTTHVTSCNLCPAGKTAPEDSSSCDGYCDSEGVVEWAEPEWKEADWGGEYYVYNSCAAAECETHYTLTKSWDNGAIFKINKCESNIYALREGQEDAIIGYLKHNDRIYKTAKLIEDTFGYRLMLSDPFDDGDQVLTEIPEQTGYSFYGYYADEDVSEPIIDPNGKLVSGIPMGFDWNVVNFGDDPEGTSGSIRLHSRFSMNNYTIDYLLDGGTNYSGAPTWYDVDDADITLGTPTKSGYVFDCWTDINNKCIYTIDTANATNVTLKATWKQAQCNATNATAIASVVDNKVKCDVTCKTGYSKNGGTDTTTTFNVTSTTNGESLDVACKARTFTISFDQNGGTSGQSDTVIATYDSAMPTINTTKPTRDACMFTGWYDTTDTTKVMYYTSEGASAKNWDKTDANTTLYAGWNCFTAKASNVTLTYNGTSTTNGSAQECSAKIVVDDITDYTITYGSTKNGAFNDQIPTLATVGKKTVFFKVDATNYGDYISSYTCEMKHATMTVQSSDKTMTYTGAAQSCDNVTVQKPTAGYTIQYGTSADSYTNNVPQITNVSNITVYYRVTGDNFNAYTGSYECTVVQNDTMEPTSHGNTKTYDGKALVCDGDIDNVPNGSTITYGFVNGTYDLDKAPTITDAETKTVYYKVTNTNYSSKTGDFVCKVTKASNPMTLNKTNGTLKVSGTDTITASNVQGSISAKSSNTDVATVSVSGSTITVTAKSAGSATITVTASGNNNYESAIKGYTVNVCTECSAGTGATCALSVVDNTCTYTTECKTGYENINNGGEHNPSCSATEYTVTYSCGDGTLIGGVNNTQQIAYLASGNLKQGDAVCKKAGYEFVEWTDGTNTYKSGVLYTMSNASDVTLTAIWEQDIITCDPGTYYAGGGTTCSPCESGYYCTGGEFTIGNGTLGGIKKCPTEYPNTEGTNATKITDCFSNKQQRKWTGSKVNGAIPTNCSDVTEWNECSIDDCEYTAYSNEDGTGDGAHRDGCEANNATCTNTPKTVTAEGGYYVDGATCLACPNGGVSDGGDIKSSACYKKTVECELANGSGTQTCYWNDSEYSKDCGTCVATKCESGYYVNNGICTECPADHVCDGTSTVATCSSLTNGVYTKSDKGSGSQHDCYKECTVSDITNSKNVSTVSGYVYFDNGNTCAIKTCKYNFVLKDDECVEKCDCGTGYKCEYEGTQCVRKGCEYNYRKANDGTCEPCNVDNAISYMQNNNGMNCKVEHCANGYHPQNGNTICEEDIRDCTSKIDHATTATETWKGKDFGKCTVTECELGYHIEKNKCVSDIKEGCIIVDKLGNNRGEGRQEWDTDTGKWGECIATKCYDGYTNDSGLTNEPWEQCGTCANKFGVNGEIAVAKYKSKAAGASDCEIATCHYSGEKYVLNDNECRFVCNTYSDITGSRYWNEATKKCEQTCSDGYTTWTDWQ